MPTWVAVAAAAIAALIALRAPKSQNKEFARQVAVLERQQADQVDVRSSPVSANRVLKHGAATWSSSYRGMTVDNGSRRPIRDIAAMLSPGDGTALIGTSEAGFTLASGTTQYQSGVLPLLRAGGECSFRFDVLTSEHPKATILIPFDDDAGLHWQIDQNLHLQKLEHRDW